LLPVFVAAFVVCLASASVVNVLHFQMKFRLKAAGLKVKWFMLPWDDFRMWRTYMSEAPIRRWPVWPFYVYRVLMVVFLLSGVIALFTVSQLGALLTR
jgi:Gpi18-like mannosyltransferase